MQAPLTVLPLGTRLVVGIQRLRYIFPLVSVSYAHETEPAEHKAEEDHFFKILSLGTVEQSKRNDHQLLKMKLLKFKNQSLAGALFTFARRSAGSNGTLTGQKVRQEGKTTFLLYIKNGI